jgi:hypothetical protein
MHKGIHAAPLRAALALLGGSFALQAMALDLGEPVLRSAPGAPLDLSIPVLCGAEECEHFDAALGGSGDYRAAHVPEPRGQLSFSYDRALDAIRVRSSAPLPAQSLHLLLDLHAGAASLRKDVVVMVPAAPPPAEEAAPAVATVTAALVAAPAPVPAPAAQGTPGPAPAPAPPPAAHREPAPDPGAQLLGLLKSLDPAQIGMGLGIGAGLLLAWLLLRFLRAVFRNTVGRWIGGMRYRLAARQRERRREDAAAQMPAGAPPAPGPRPAPAQPGSAAKAPALPQVQDELARRLRAQIAAEPQRLDLKLKLAERLFAVRDGEAYTDLVMALRPELKETAWERLRRMGQELRPYDDRFLNLSDRSTVDTVPLIKSNY